MSQARLLNVLCAPVISEKSSAAHEKNTLVFKVLKNATKDEIKAAVESIFNVKVVSVNTVNCIGKTRRMGRNVGKRPDYKKAIVRLAAGETIEFFQA